MYEKHKRETELKRELEVEDIEEMLISTTELLRRNGHTNPELYPIKKLLALTERVRRYEIEKIVQESLFDHSSRVAVMTGDISPYKELISNVN
ncbi:hypothetical protein P5E67_00785 [Vibrio parahaemolyticus]|nr:hypothetical protein [Vibrio parahaemolyticus]